jgi:putative zinc finger protein
MPNRAECEAVVSQLWPFVDGMVSETQREFIVDHLEQCEPCQSHFDFAKAFLEAVHEAKPHFDVDDGLSDRVMAALAGAGYRG